MRIKKKGLDYFPLDTDFMQNRVVRRIMKREGDAALAVLMGTLSAIYAGEGYYVQAGRDFYEDLASNLFEKDAADVERILNLALEYGLFDAGMFASHGILTSEHIQEQFLFCTRRRKRCAIDPRYSLCVEDIPEASGPGEETGHTAGEASGSAVPAPENVTFTPKNVTSGTQSKAKHSKANTPLSQGSPKNGEGPASAVPAARGGDGGRSTGGKEREEARAKPVNARRAPAPHEWTEADIDELAPPRDGLQRNFEGLKFSLRQYRIPLHEQYAIILKSNFGVIGHPLWKGFHTLRESHGKIRQPGKYLLSLCWGKRKEGG